MDIIKITQEPYVYYTLYNICLQVLYKEKHFHQSVYYKPFSVYNKSLPATESNEETTNMAINSKSSSNKPHNTHTHTHMKLSWDSRDDQIQREKKQEKFIDYQSPFYFLSIL